MEIKVTDKYSFNMKGVTKCPKCGGHEYVGMLHWRDGGQMCRVCIAAHWRRYDKFEGEAFKYDFPLYSDGKNYVEFEE